MALRLAERQRNFQTLVRRNYTTDLRTARFFREDSGVLDLRFGPGLTVLCGLNGAGKSSTLASIWYALAGGEGAPAHLPRVPEWLIGLELSGISAGEEWDISYDFTLEAGSNSGFLSSVEYVDSSAETEKILMHMRRDDNPDDLLEGIDPAPFSDRERALLGFLVGREYEDVSTYEITSFSEDDEAMPYFVASSHGVQYSSLRMGRGELNAAYMLWRLSSCEPGSVVLLEEPETHLAHSSQAALIDVLISLIVDRDLTVVTSSHAPGFFRRLPDPHTALLVALPRPRIESGLSTSRVAEHLGLAGESGPLIVVEDPVGELLLRTLLQELGSTALKSSPIRFAANGESGVRRVLDELSGGSRDDGQILAIYDGDQRASGGSEGLYLPGNLSPEHEIRKIVKRWQAGEFEAWVPEAFGGRGEFELLLQLSDGLDQHDWLEEIAKRNGGKGSTIRSFVKLMLMDDAFAEQSRSLVAAIEQRGIRG